MTDLASTLLTYLLTFLAAIAPVFTPWLVAWVHLRVWAWRQSLRAAYRAVIRAFTLYPRPDYPRGHVRDTPPHATAARLSPRTPGATPSDAGDGAPPSPVPP